MVVRCFGRLLVLFSLYQISASPARPHSGILSRLVNGESVCGPEIDSRIYCSIYKQCIVSTAENEITYGIGDFVAKQPSLFSDSFGNESLFRKAVFEKLINPWLMKAQVEFAHLLNSCCVIFAYSAYLTY